MSKIETAVINSIAGIANILFAIIISIILVPIYLRFFSISLWGSWLASGSIINMFSVFEAGLSLILTQKLSVAKAKNDNNFINIYFNGILITSLISAFIFLIGIFIIPYIPELVKVQSEYNESLLKGLFYSLISTALTVFTIPYLVIPQVYLKPLLPGLLNLFALIFSVVVILICLNLNYGISSIGLGYLCKSLIIFIGNFIYSFTLIKEYKVVKYQINTKEISLLFKEITFPFISRLSNILTNSTQNLAIAFFISPNMVAIYDFTSKITITIKMLLNTIGMATFSGFSLTFANSDRNYVRKIVNQFLLFYSLLAIYGYGLSLVFSKNFIKLWVGLDKYGGNILLILISISLVINDFLTILNVFGWSSGNYTKSSKYEILNSIIYLLLLLSLIKFFNVYTIPIALGLSSLLILFIIYNKVIKRIDLHFSFLFRPFLIPILIVVCISILCSLVSIFWYVNNWGIDILFAMIFTLSYFFLIYKFSFIHWENFSKVLRKIISINLIKSP